MTEVAQLRGDVCVLIRKVEELTALVRPKRKPMSRQAFAEATGYSYKTICRWVHAGQLPEVDGKIPAECLDRYLS